MSERRIQYNEHSPDCDRNRSYMWKYEAPDCTCDVFERIRKHEQQKAEAKKRKANQ